MTPLTDAQLLQLLTDLESDRVERKSAWMGNAPDECRQALCAFANDLPGHGEANPRVIFVGINDDGSASNIDVTDALLLTLSDMKTDGKTVPPPTMTVEKRVLNGTSVATVTV